MERPSEARQLVAGLWPIRLRNRDRLGLSESLGLFDALVEGVLRLRMWGDRPWDNACMSSSRGLMAGGRESPGARFDPSDRRRPTGGRAGSVEDLRDDRDVLRDCIEARDAGLWEEAKEGLRGNGEGGLRGAEEAAALRRLGPGTL